MLSPLGNLWLKFKTEQCLLLKQPVEVGADKLAGMLAFLWVWSSRLSQAVHSNLKLHLYSQNIHPFSIVQAGPIKILFLPVLLLFLQLGCETRTSPCRLCASSLVFQPLHSTHTSTISVALPHNGPWVQLQTIKTHFIFPGVLQSYF